MLIQEEILVIFWQLIRIFPCASILSHPEQLGQVFNCSDMSEVADVDKDIECGTLANQGHLVWRKVNSQMPSSYQRSDDFILSNSESPMTDEVES